MMEIEEKIKIMRDAAERILASDDYDEQLAIMLDALIEIKEL